MHFNVIVKHMLILLITLHIALSSFIDNFIIKIDNDIHNTISAAFSNTTLTNTITSKADALIYKTFNVFALENAFNKFKVNVYNIIISEIKTTLTQQHVDSINNAIKQYIPRSFLERTTQTQKDVIVNTIYDYLERNMVITAITSDVLNGFMNEVSLSVYSLSKAITSFIFDDSDIQYEQSDYDSFEQLLSQSMISFIENEVMNTIDTNVHLVISNEVNVLFHEGKYFDTYPQNIDNIGIYNYKTEILSFNPSIYIDLTNVESSSSSNKVKFIVGNTYTFYLSHMKGFVRKCKSTFTLTNTHYTNNKLSLYFPPHCIEHIISPLNSLNQYYLSFIYTKNIFGTEFTQPIRLIEAPITVIVPSHLQQHPFKSGYNDNERTLDSDFIIDSSYLDPYVLFEYKIDNDTAYTMLTLTKYSNLSEQILQLQGNEITFIIYNSKGRIIYTKERIKLLTSSNTFQMSCSSYVLIAKTATTSQQVVFSFNNETISNTINIYENNIKIAVKAIGATSVIYNVPSYLHGDILYSAEYKGIYKDFFNITITSAHSNNDITYRNLNEISNNAIISIPTLLYNIIKTIKNPFYEFDDSLANALTDRLLLLWDSTYGPQVEAKVTEYLKNKFQGETFDSLMRSLPDNIESWLNEGLTDKQKEYLQQTTEELFSSTMIDTVIDDLLINVIRPLIHVIISEKIEDIIEDTFDSFSLTEQLLIRSGINVVIQVVIEKKSLSTAIASTYMNIKASIAEKINDLKNIFSFFKSQQTYTVIPYSYVHEKEITQLVPELTVTLGKDTSSLNVLSSDTCSIGLIKANGNEFIKGAAYEGGDKTYRLCFDKQMIKYYSSVFVDNDDDDYNKYYVAIQVEGLLTKKVYVLYHLEVEVVSMYNNDFIRNNLFINHFVHNGKHYIYDDLQLKWFHAVNKVMKYNINNSEYYIVNLNDDNTNNNMPTLTYGDVVNAVVYGDGEIVALIASATVIENVKVYTLNHKYVYAYNANKETTVPILIENESNNYNNINVVLYVNGIQCESNESLVFPAGTKAFYIVEYEYNNIRRYAFALFIGIIQIKNADNLNEITSLLVDMLSQWRDSTTTNNNNNAFSSTIQFNILKVLEQLKLNITAQIDDDVDNNTFSTNDIENYVEHVVDNAFGDSSGVIEDKFKEFLMISITESLPEDFLWNKMNEIQSNTNTSNYDLLIQGSIDLLLNIISPDDYNETFTYADKKEFISILRIWLQSVGDKLFQNTLISKLINNIKRKTLTNTISSRISTLISAINDALTIIDINDPIVNNVQQIVTYAPLVNFEVPLTWEDEPPSFFDNIGETQYYIGLKPLYSSNVVCERTIDNFGEHRNISVVFKPECISSYTQYNVCLAVKKKIFSSLEYYKYYKLTNAYVQAVNPTKLVSPFVNAPSPSSSSSSCVMPMSLVINDDYNLHTDAFYEAVTKVGTTTYYHKVGLPQYDRLIRLDEWVNVTSFVFYDNDNVIYAKKQCTVKGPRVTVDRTYFIVNNSTQRASFSLIGCDRSMECTLHFCGNDNESPHNGTCPVFIATVAFTMNYIVDTSHKGNVNIYLTHKDQPEPELKYTLTVVEDINTLFNISGMDILCEYPGEEMFTQSYLHVYVIEETNNALLSVKAANGFSGLGDMIWKLGNVEGVNGMGYRLNYLKFLDIYESKETKVPVVSIMIKPVHVSFTQIVGIANWDFYLNYPCKVYKLSLEKEDGKVIELDNTYDVDKERYSCVMKEEKGEGEVEGEVEEMIGKYALMVNYEKFGDVELVEFVERKDKEEDEEGNVKGNESESESGGRVMLGRLTLVVLFMLL